MFIQSPAEATTQTSDVNRRAASCLILASIVAALYFGRDVFVPLALAVLLSFALAPLCRWIEKIHVPRAPAVIAVVIFAFAIIFGIGGLIGSQMRQLAADLPSYEMNIRNKISSLRGTAATSATLERAADVLTELNKEINKPKDASPATERTLQDATGRDARPIPVEVRQPPPTALESLAALITPLLHPLTTTGIVAVFVIFTLMQREDLRNRLIKLAGTQDLQKTTIALDDTAGRIGKLFLSQLALNFAVGLVIGSGLWAIGIPSAPLWGVLAGVLRFVPYIGAVISAVFPLMLAVAVDPGWTLLLWTAALFIVVEPLAGHVVEPLLYGRSTGLSPFAVMISATFWTTLWGAVGLVLATPLTICLVVLGRHIESLRFLDVMLGDRPALLPEELFYQRMLANDPAEALDKASEFLKEKPLYLYYDEVALKGLSLAQADLDRGALDSVHLRIARDAAIETIDELNDYDDKAPTAEVTTDPEAEAALDSIKNPSPLYLPDADPARLPAAWTHPAAILCLPGRPGLDEAAAHILLQIIQKHGLTGSSLDPSATKSLSQDGETQIAFASFFTSQNPAQMRYAIRRLRRRLPTAKIFLACWGYDGDLKALADTANADAAVASIHQAVSLAVGLASQASTAPAEQTLTSRAG